ncbi:MAG: methyltransferase domain-containing protein [Bryobacteraceae bacterium]
MNELLKALPPGAWVLDLGCASGSFRAAGSCRMVRVDLEIPHSPVSNLVQADAAKLPFPDHCFDAIISNHSLEHFTNLTSALEEMGRVIKPAGALYVSVPDATTFCDLLYRWLARGGGHVNAFRSAPQLVAKVRQVTGLKHVATRTLHTSLSFLNRHNAPRPRPRKLLLLGNGTETSLRLINYLSRLSDRFLHTRLTVYGWALYFGNIAAHIDTQAWINVCIRCGAGHPSAWLSSQPNLLHRRWFLRVYSCPNCGTLNLFAHDRSDRQF